jgi:AraC-like DNA-binding protein
MPLIEAALRGGALTLLLLIAVLRLREARRSPAGLYAGLFALSVAAYVVESSPDLLTSSAIWLLPLRLVAIGTVAVFWLLATASFDDEFKASWRDAVPWLGLVGVGMLCICGHYPVACFAFQAAQLGFAGLALRQAVIGRNADLVEERRRFRVLIIVASAIYTVALIVLQFEMHGPPAGPPFSTINAASLLALIFALTLAQLSLAQRSLYAADERVATAGAPPAATRVTEPPPATAADGQELALLQRLQALMSEERAYREEGLSIAGLAARLDLPEYRLRRLINGRLGFRNFNAFVNGYRLEEAMAALADPAQAVVPIVTIALDAGFQSLGPFNRAFKTHTGVTPTDYRRDRLGEAR